MKLFTTAACAVFFFATSLLAHDYKAGEISVMHPMTFETAENVKVGGGYMSITNAGGSADRLLEVRVPSVPRVELHLSQTDENGIARMFEQKDGIEIPAGGEVTLQPGGLHVMFMGLAEPFEAGQKIPATHVFEKAGALEVTFNVEARSADDHKAVDHSDHSNHGTN